MEDYDSKKKRSNGFRIKEMGDGFLCSVGYPFDVPGKDGVANWALQLAKRFVEIFDQHCSDKNIERTCCIGISYGEIEGYFPSSGIQEFQLFGASIVHATRYQELRKHFEFPPRKNLLVIQESVYQKLAGDFQEQCIVVPINDGKTRVRDDYESRSFYFIALKPVEYPQEKVS